MSDQRGVATRVAPVDLWPMGPRDRPSPLPDGASCTACGAPVPTGRIRLLARRDGLAFVRLACDGCGSSAIGLLMDGAGDEPVLDVATETPWTGQPPMARGSGPITDADVESVRRDLAGWDGDLLGWLDR